MIAVTSLGDDVFVLRLLSRQIEVYNARTFTLQRHVTFSTVGCHRYLCGLAACARYKCLYVSDSDDSVHRTQLSRFNVAMKWSVASGPRGLSVNKAHNVVVACYGAYKLLEYTTHGALVREISLQQAGVTRPWHAVQLSTGDYVVTYGTSPGAVIVVGVDGQVVCRYDPSHVGQMRYPRSVAVTKNDDILIIDLGNNRILSMNSSLSSVRALVLPVDSAIQKPWGLCLDESRRRLYVNDGGGCRVLVFKSV